MRSTIALAAVFILTSALSLLGQEKAAPEATVSASSGPVKIVFSIYRTHIKLKKEIREELDDHALYQEFPDFSVREPTREDYARYRRKVMVDVPETVWFKLTLVNIGKRPIVVSDGLFNNEPYWKGLEVSQRSRYGIYFEILGSDRQDMDLAKTAPYEGCFDSLAVSPNQPSPAEQKKFKKRWDAWKKAGFSDREMRDKLDAENHEYWRRERNKFKPISRKRLKPGKSVSTSPGYYTGYCEGDVRENPPQQVGDFSEFWDYPLNKAGTYQIRAVYGHAPLEPDVARSEEVVFKTPYIQVEVKP